MLVAHLGDLGQPLPGVLLVVLLLEADRHDVLDSGAGHLRLPVAGGVQRRLADLGAHLRIAQVLEEFAARRGPGRQTGREAGAAGDVGVHVGGDVEPFGAGGVDAGDD